MIRKMLVFVFILSISLTGYTLDDPVAILKELDAQRFLPGSTFKMKMIITYKKGETRERVFEGFEKGSDFFFIKFLSPARDKGTRYLKREGVMWLYLPKVDKVIKIKGHMLRQGMMGSDFSYEDAAENTSLLEDYTPSLIGEEQLALEDAYILELVARRPDVTYYRRKLWVGKKTLMPLKSELYAKSGKLLKIGTVDDIRRLEDRYYPYKMTMKNVLKRDSLTVMEVLEIKIGADIDPQVFELRHLKRQE